MMCTAPLPPDPVFITHSPPFPMISYLNYDAAEHRRLQASGDYRCPRGQGPADLRRMEGGFDLAAVPWFMRGPNGIDVGLATDLSQLGWSMREYWCSTTSNSLPISRISRHRSEGTTG